MDKRQLVEALVLDAIRTFHVYVHVKKPGERQRFAEVEAWILSEFGRRHDGLN